MACRSRMLASTGKAPSSCCPRCTRTSRPAVACNAHSPQARPEIPPAGVSMNPDGPIGGPPRALPITVAGLAVLAVSHGAIFARMAAAPALAIAAWRVTIAAAAVALLLPWHWQALRAGMTRVTGLATLGASLCLALHFATWISSLNYTSVSNSVILVNTSPIWVLVIGWLSRAETPSRRTLIAAALAVAGAAIISFAGAAKPGGGLRGDLLALAGGAAMG